MTRLPTQVTEVDLHWMQVALSMAEAAEAAGEVPVGAVLVLGEECVGKGWNSAVQRADPSAHAEILALRDAGSHLGNYRLPGCTMYVTLEPCAMCVGALIHARIERLVYGASDPKTGALGGHFDLIQSARHNHEFSVSGGCLAEACSSRLKAFFRARRKGGAGPSNSSGRTGGH